MNRNAWRRKHGKSLCGASLCGASLGEKSLGEKSLCGASRRGTGIGLRAAAAALLLAVSGGCGAAKIDAEYGRRTGASVAGASVLGRMFYEADFRVSSWRRISPKLNESSIVVWIPDDFQPPKLRQRIALEKWLAGGDGRTLLYVGRDYDAASQYWRFVRDAASGEPQFKASQLLARARSEQELRRAAMPDQEYARWFTAERQGKVRQIRSLHSEYGWTDNVDATQVSILLDGRLRPPTPEDVAAPSPAMLALQNNAAPPGDFQSDQIAWSQLVEDQKLPQIDVLLESQGEPLVWRCWTPQWGGSQVIVVANGSFLLNLPLVNREHRKLAQQLLQACAANSANRRVTFLESGPGGPPVFASEPQEGSPTGLELFSAWPLGLLLLHLLFAGVVACFAMFPHLGRPRDEVETGESDFSRHVNAIGELLEDGAGHQYAIDRIRHYHQVVKRDSGASHAER